MWCNPCAASLRMHDGTRTYSFRFVALHGNRTRMPVVTSLVIYRNRSLPSQRGPRLSPRILKPSVASQWSVECTSLAAPLSSSDTLPGAQPVRQHAKAIVVQVYSIPTSAVHVLRARWRMTPSRQSARHAPMRESPRIWRGESSGQLSQTYPHLLRTRHLLQRPQLRQLQPLEQIQALGSIAPHPHQRREVDRQHQRRQQRQHRRHLHARLDHLAIGWTPPALTRE